ncbi:MAG: NADH-quinone oxidoreductase subunit M [Desulfurivibrio sp.]
MQDVIFNNSGYPLLSIMLFLPLAGAILVALIDNTTRIKWTAMLVTLLNILLCLPLLTGFDGSTHLIQFAEHRQWIASWNINYFIGVDGISVLFVALSALISFFCVLVSWRAITEKIKLFYVTILLTETAMIGVFVALDLFLFYIFWEAVLIPMFMLIIVWGGANRSYAAVKFFLFTLAGSLLMLVGMVSIYLTGGGTFNILELAQTDFARNTQIWLFLAFFVAFAIKVPMFPFHTWLPHAHTEAPTAGSVILAGVLIKMGAYGFLRFSLPMFPEAVMLFARPLLIMSLIAIVYGALVTLMQKDIKRLIAYSSVSHMGFVTMGLFSLNLTGVQGGIYQMISHGLVTGALFMAIGMIYERTHTREIADYGGLARAVPLYTAFFTVFALAATGFPGTNSFIGEFLIISGALQANPAIGALSVLGVVLGLAYIAWLYYRVFLFEVNETIKDRLSDLSIREVLILVPFAAMIIYFGLKPAFLLDYMHASVTHLLAGITSAAP